MAATAAEKSIRLYADSELAGLTAGKLSAIYIGLREAYRELLLVHAETERRLANSVEKLNLAQAARFGRKSERSVATAESKEQRNEDGEATDSVEESDEHSSGDSDHAEKKAFRSTARKRPVRSKGCAKKVWEDLPVRDVHVELTKDELIEKFGEGEWRDFSEKVYETIRYIPASCYIERTHIHVYRSAGKFAVAGSAPAKLWPKSLASPSLIAGILNDKFVLGMPAYRIWQEFLRNGLKLTSQCMNSWITRCGIELFEPVVMRMKKLMFETRHIQADETPVTVGHAADGKRSECRFWVFRTSDLTRGPTITVFHFALTRSTDELREFLEDYRGTITCDGYVSYRTYEREHPKDITVTGCLTHCRRYFTDVLKAMRSYHSLEDKEKQKIPAHQAVEKLGKIFSEEKKLKTLESAERLEQRKERIAPLVDDFFTWVKSFGSEDFESGGLTEKAMNYSLNQEPYLRRFLEDGLVPLHNSSCEQSIIPFCVGRNNWKCIDSIDGATAAGYHYTIAETARRNGANIYLYYRFLLERLPGILATHSGSGETFECLDSLMPWNDEYRRYETECLAEIRKT